MRDLACWIFTLANRSARYGRVSIITRDKVIQKFCAIEELFLISECQVYLVYLVSSADNYKISCL